MCDSYANGSYDGQGEYRWDYDDLPRYNQGNGPIYAQDLLKQHAEGYNQVTVLGKKGEVVPEAMSTFELCDNVFPPVIMKQLRNAGFTEPMPIQASTWAMAIQGRDVIGVAKNWQREDASLPAPWIPQYFERGVFRKGSSSARDGADPGACEANRG